MSLTAAASTNLFRPATPPLLREPVGLVTFLRMLRRNPLTTWTPEHFEKPIVLGDGALGRVTVINDPAAIRRVFVDNAANYRKDELQRRVLAPGLGRGLLMAEGDEWRLQRRTLAPLFAARHVESFAGAMTDAGARLLGRWRRRGEGVRLDIGHEMTRVTLDVLERTIFSHGLPRDPDALGRAITRYFEALGPVDPLDLFGLPAWLPRLGRLKARPAIRFFEEVVTELIETRRRLVASGAPAPRDLLTLLIEASDPETGKGLSDEEVGANIVTFIGAGHETTANALTWTLYLVSQVEAVRARLEAEADSLAGEPSLADLPRLPFTRAVLDEALRLFPPVPFMSRAAIREDRIGPYKIPARSLVIVAPYLLHRHRTLWADPDAFDPERFLAPRKAGIDRFAYLPFGIGPRVCIGASFSLQESVLILATIARHARLQPISQEPLLPLHRVTLRPEGGLAMRLTLRT